MMEGRPPRAMTVFANINLGTVFHECAKFHQDDEVKPGFGANTNELERRGYQLREQGHAYNFGE